MMIQSATIQVDQRDIDWYIFSNQPSRILNHSLGQSWSCSSTYLGGWGGKTAWAHKFESAVN